MEIGRRIKSSQTGGIYPTLPGTPIGDGFLFRHLIGSSHSESTKSSRAFGAPTRHHNMRVSILWLIMVIYSCWLFLFKIFPVFSWIGTHWEYIFNWFMMFMMVPLEVHCVHLFWTTYRGRTALAQSPEVMQFRMQVSIRTSLGSSARCKAQFQAHRAAAAP